MGMFDKDKEIGRQMVDTFAKGEEFILYAVAVEEDAVKTNLGLADKTTMTVARMNQDTGQQIGDRFDINALGDTISSKAKEASDDDFPAVVCWITVPSKKFNSDATVLQFVRDYED